LPDGPGARHARRSLHRIKIFRTEKEMLLTVSLLSSIAQSRVGQWVRALALMQRRVRY
jgi:hypothetical protein